jgi:uncharacterized coiled-coil protein SlyX
MAMPLETERLVDELLRERAELFDALSAVAPGSMTTPGLLAEWSARDLVAHLGYWTGHAAEIIHAVEQARTDEIGAGEPTVDEINETVARVARQTELAMVMRREAASVDALVERLRALDPALLEIQLPDGATLAEGIREDGSAHYAEHAAELRRTLAEAPRG